MKTDNYLLSVTLLTWSVLAVGNPGILLSAPFPLPLPPIPINLPTSIDNIAITNLELTNISLRQLQFNWKIDIKNAEVNVSVAQVSFDWFYKKDKGFGFFRQDLLRLEVFYQFTTSNNGHLQLTVTSTKIHPGHSKVSLGGGTSQIVIVEVTNLILNHASILFRGFISKQISQTISDFGSILGEDIKIYTDKQSGKEYYLNLSLVANPMISNQNLLVQIDGAPYIKGSSSGPLNPEDILVKQNTSKIQIQIHKKIVDTLILLMMKQKGQFGLTLHTLDITSIIDVDSLHLSSIFPKMGLFPDNRDVIFNLRSPAVNFSFHNNHLRFQVGLYSNIVTFNTIDKREQLYLERIDGKFGVEIVPIFGKKKCSMRIAKTEVLDFSPNQEDIDSGKIYPNEFVKYFDFLTEWIGDAINLELNRKVQSFGFKNILAVLKGKVLKDTAYYLEVDLIEV